MNNAKTFLDLFKLVTPMSGHSYESTQEVLSRLKFIGTLQAGERVDVHNQCIENNTILTGVKRMFYGEGREATYAFFTNTIERAFAILYSLVATEKLGDRMVCSHILQDMMKAMNGIKNMQITYQTDKKFMCNLETLVQAVQAKMYEVRQRYPDIYSTALVLATPDSGGDTQSRSEPSSPALSSSASSNNTATPSLPTSSSNPFLLN
jgi:hypothetical protein